MDIKEEVPEKKDKKDTYKSQEGVSIMSLIAELPNLVILAVLAVVSGSVIMALDVFESLSNIIQGTLTYRLSKKMQGDASFRYDYGMGKIDAFGSLMSASLLFLGLVAILIGAINSIINPSDPSDLLLWAIIAKGINTLISIYLMLKQSKIAKTSDSPLVKSAFIFLKKDVLTDSIVLVTIAVSYIFRAFPIIEYFEPVVCIICIIYVAVMNIKQIRSSMSILLDKTLDEETQLQIINCVTKIWNDIDEFKEVRTRKSGSLIFIDLLVSFDDSKKYGEIYQTYKEFETAIQEILPDSEVSLVIRE